MEIFCKCFCSWKSRLLRSWKELRTHHRPPCHKPAVLLCLWGKGSLFPWRAVCDAWEKLSTACFRVAQAPVSAFQCVMGSQLYIACGALLDATFVFFVFF